MSSITTEIDTYLKNHEADENTITALEVKVIDTFLNLNSLTPHEASATYKLKTSFQDKTFPLSMNSLFNTVETISTDDLVSSFELLVPKEEAKAFGAFFTPEEITSFMAKELVGSLQQQDFKLSEVKILDPAVGCGALLIAVAHELAGRTGRTFSECAAQLTGTDLSANSIQRARILFELIGLKEGDTILPTPNLRVESGLLKNDELFDGVIANPPYVRYQTIGDDLRAQLKEEWQSCQNGNYNLYFPFMEKAYLSLNEKGSAYFITPNGFIDSKSGAGLRAWMKNNESLKSIIDFGKNKVFQVMAYTAITHFEKTPHESISYAKVAGALGLKDYALQAKNTYAYKDLTEKSWEFIDAQDSIAVETMRANPIALDSIFDVRVGLQTSGDKLFMFKGESVDGFYHVSKDGIDYRIEEGLVKKCVKVSQIRHENDITTDSLKVIYPYLTDNKNAVAMTEEYVKENFPEGYLYLLSIKDELIKRDGGKKEYPVWFAYARSQGLVPYKDKLLSPLYLIQPRFMLDSEDSLFINGCALVPKKGVEVDLLKVQAFLNSDAVKNFMLATSNPIDGGFVAYHKSQLGRIRFPEM